MGPGRVCAIAWVLAFACLGIGRNARGSEDDVPQTSCAIAVTSLATTAQGGIAWDILGVTASVTSACQVQSVVADGAGHSAPLSFDAAQNNWSGSLDLAAAPHGPFVLTVTAIDVFGNTATRSVTLTHDLPPAVVIDAPSFETVAQPGVHVTASCQDDDRCTLDVYAQPAGGSCTATFASPLLLISAHANAIDQDVSLAPADGCDVFLVVNAVDSAGQIATAARRIAVESNPRYVEHVHVGGRVVDDSATHTLFLDESNRLALLEKATGHTTVVWSTAPASAYVTPVGAIFEDSSFQIIHEWRNGAPSPDSSPGWGLVVNGPYAVWNTKEDVYNDFGHLLYTLKCFVRRDLATGATERGGCSTQTEDLHPTVGPNGDVIWQTLDPFTPSQLWRYRQGMAYEQLTSVPWGVDLLRPRTDGVNVVYGRQDRTSGIGPFETRLITPAGEVTLASLPAAVLTGGTEYAVSNGWTAFSRYVNGSVNVWVRAPDGSETQKTFFGTPSAWVAALNDDGRVAIDDDFNGANQSGRLLLAPGATPAIDVGMSWAWQNSMNPATRGRVAAYWRDGQLFMVVGGSVMQVVENLCSTSVLTPASARVAQGGGMVTVGVSAAADCTWTAVSNSAFATITNGSTGTGAGAVTISVSASPHGLPRQGALTIGRQRFVIVQDGRAAVPGDFSGSGMASPAVFRPDNGTWYVDGQGPRQFGAAGDIPVAGDYNGDRIVDAAVYRPATGEWFIADQPTIQFGPFIGIPVPADYDGDGVTDAAYYDTHAQLAVWTVRGQPNRQFGLASDIPRPADLDGDGRADLVVYRRETGEWFVEWSSSNYTSWSMYQWGALGDIPLTGDVNGDGRADLIAFRPSTATWYIRLSELSFSTAASLSWGLPGDVPLAVDINGDAHAELCAFRRSSGEWYCYDRASGIPDVRQWGQPGDIPAVQAPARAAVIGRDADGDGSVDIAIFRPGAGEWYTLFAFHGAASWNEVQWGASGDIPVPGDYDGDGRRDAAVFRPSEGRWYVLNSSDGQWWTRLLGGADDIPVAADYDGDGRTDIATYNAQTGDWQILRSTGGFATIVVHRWGLAGDRPAPADYDGDGRVDFAVYRPANGMWYVALTGANFAMGLTVSWGLPGDTPMPADFDGDGRADLAVFRPSTGEWFVLLSQYADAGSIVWPSDSFSAGDLPVVGDFDGDGRSDFTTYRPSTGEWRVGLASQSLTIVRHWGLPDDLPLDRQ